MSTKKVLGIIALVICLTLCGASGYMLIEGWDFFDSLYMTIITLTTTGYQEVYPLGPGGRAFTIVLLVLGMGIVGYSISIIMSYVINIDFDKRKRERMMQKVENLTNHIIVCGFGRMGAVICEHLSHSNAPFVVIETDHEKIEFLKKSNWMWIEGDAANDDNLIKAGVKQARVLVSMIDDDSDGLYIALAGRSLNQKLTIIVRASDEKAERRILRAGANKVVLPIIMSGIKIAECVLNPAVEDLLTVGGVDAKQEDRIQLADMIISDKSDLVNETLMSKGKEMTDLIIVGVRKSDGKFVFKPGPNYIFEVGDCLISMGRVQAYWEAIDRFKLSTHEEHDFGVEPERG